MTDSSLSLLIACIIGIFICISIINTLNARKNGKARWGNPNARLAIFKTKIVPNTQIIAEGGELGPIFWSEAIRNWRLATNNCKDYSLIIIFGPTLQVLENHYYSYIEGKYKVPGAIRKPIEWVNVHPVIQAWWYDTDLKIQLYFKPEHNLKEGHYAIVKGPEKIVVIEEQHGSAPAKGGMVYRGDTKEYNRVEKYFEEMLCSAPNEKIRKIGRDEKSALDLMKDINFELINAPLG